MALNFDDLDHTSINEIGSELANARELTNRTSQDFVLDLRTTRHHINAIEAGDLRIFYGAPFYIDLMKRYAKSLNFSEEQILLFEKRVTGYSEVETEDSTMNLKGKNTLGLNQATTEIVNKEVFSKEVIKREKLTIDSEEAKNLKEKNDRILFILVFIVIVLGAFVFGFPVIQSKSILDGGIIQTNSLENNNNKFIKSSEITKKNNVAKESRSSKIEIIENNSLKPLQVAEKQTKNITLVKNIKEIQVLDESSEKRGFSLNNQIPDVSLFVEERTWFWIRYADDTIKEFMVDSNTKVEVPDFPIYLVIGNPERVEMSIRGSVVLIKRNDPERNLARFTRTELISFTQQEDY